MLLFIVIVGIFYLLQWFNTGMDDDPRTRADFAAPHQDWRGYHPIGSTDMEDPVMQQEVCATGPDEDVALSAAIAAATGSIGAGYAAGNSISGAMMGAAQHDSEQSLSARQHLEGTFAHNNSVHGAGHDHFQHHQLTHDDWASSWSGHDTSWFD